MTPLALVPDEGPLENLRNAQQLLQAYTFLNDEQRVGNAGWECIRATAYRIAIAVGQLETEVERQRLHPEEKVNL